MSWKPGCHGKRACAWNRDPFKTRVCHGNPGLVMESCQLCHGNRGSHINITSHVMEILVPVSWKFYGICYLCHGVWNLLTTSICQLNWQSTVICFFFPRTLGVMSTPEFLFSDLWSVLNKTAISKFQWGLFGGKGLERGVIALWSLLNFNNGTRTSDFQSN